jgi:hypothetical protein
MHNLRRNRRPTSLVNALTGDESCRMRKRHLRFARFADSRSSSWLLPSKVLSGAALVLPSSIRGPAQELLLCIEVPGTMAKASPGQGMTIRTRPQMTMLFGLMIFIAFEVFGECPDAVRLSHQKLDMVIDDSSRPRTESSRQAAMKRPALSARPYGPGAELCPPNLSIKPLFGLGNM